MDEPANIHHTVPLLFHIAPLPLEVGSVILPGNWGRIIRHCGETHTQARRELELEAVRAAEFAAKPSRLEATFSFRSEPAARFFLTTRPTDILYVVEHVTPEAPQHVGDLNAVDPVKGRGETWAFAARRYWGGVPPAFILHGFNEPHLEVVSTSPLRVVVRIS